MQDQGLQALVRIWHINACKIQDLLGNLAQNQQELKLDQGDYLYSRCTMKQ